MIGKDKFIHFLVCLIAAFLVSLCTWFMGKGARLMCGALFAMGLALGKECGDLFNPQSTWDWWDLVADCIGISVAVIVGVILY